MASSPPTSPPSKDSPPTPPSSNSTSNSSSPPSPPSSGSSSSPPPPPTPSSSPPPTAPPPKSSTPSSSPPPPEQKSPPPEDGGRNSPPPPTPPVPPPSSAGKSQGSPPSGNNNGPPQSPPSVPSSSSTRTPPSPSSSGALHSPSSSGGGGMLSAPPPPAHKGTSSSHSSGNSPSSSGKSSSSPSPTTMTSATVIGVGASAAFVALVMVVFCVTCVSKKRKRRHEPMQYYADYSSGGPRGGEYYSGPSSWHNNNSHMMKVPPPPGMGMGMPPSGGGGSWGPGPPPMMMSADMSGNFSGGPPLPPPSPGISLGFNKSTFSYDELAAATNGFSQANLLGQGGFGYVHKGVLPNGKEIAVKSLKSGSGQGEREFQAEVEIISRVHHRHLVSLVGYCIAESRRMLVYDFVSNNTMEYHLHGEGRPTMDWPTRLRIALGSAKGLAYLHEDCHPRIIHRDIKAANILLDNNYEAMVADFGLAKLSADNHTHVSTRVMGTFGYLAPEYASSGKLTEKSDVFSFGVMLLELVTGRRPVDTTNTYMEDSLADWARPIMSQSLEEGNFDELVDPHLEGNYNPHELACMVSCAAASVRHSAKRRPKMSQIVRALEGDAMLDDMNEGMKQGHSAKYSSNGNSSEYDSGLYNADMKKFRKAVMSSQEFDSSDYSGGGGDSREMSQPWKLKPPPPRPNHFS